MYIAAAQLHGNVAYSEPYLSFDTIKELVTFYETYADKLQRHAIHCLVIDLRTAEDVMIYQSLSKVYRISGEIMSAFSAKQW